MVAILDNEGAFEESAYSVMTNELDAVKNFIRMNNKNYGTIYEKNKNELREFLEDSSEEYHELLKEVLNTLTPSMFISILDDIETNEFILNGNLKEKIVIPNKDSLIALYTDRYNIMLEVLLANEKKSGKTV